MLSGALWTIAPVQVYLTHLLQDSCADGLWRISSKTPAVKIRLSTPETPSGSGLDENYKVLELALPVVVREVVVLMICTRLKVVRIIHKQSSPPVNVEMRSAA